MGSKKHNFQTPNRWFDMFSIAHGVSIGIIYFAAIKLTSIDAFILLIAINLLHVLEDILENYTHYSLECLFKNCNGKPPDNDSFQNFAGDIISGFITSSTIFVMTRLMK